MEEIYNDYSSDVKEIDKELAEILKRQSAKIKVVGVGGGGEFFKQNERNRNKGWRTHCCKY